MKQDNNSSKTASTSNVSEKELLRKTFLHELKQDYIYKAMCNPAYKDLMAQKKDVLAHNPLTNEDIRILARTEKQIREILIDTIFKGTYKDFYKFNETFQLCATVGDIEYTDTIPYDFGNEFENAFDE
jgi:hypothetical protein